MNYEEEIVIYPIFNSFFVMARAFFKIKTKFVKAGMKFFVRIAIFSFLFSGHFSFYGQKAKLTCPSKDVIIKQLALKDGFKIIPGTKWNYKNTIDTFLIGKDSGDFKLINEESLILLQKKKCKNKTVMVLRSEALDSKKRIKLEAIEPYPEKTKTAMYVDVDQVTFSVSTKDCQRKIYDDYKSYKENRMDHFSTVDKGFAIEKSIFDESLNEFLANIGFLDTTYKLNISDFNHISVHITVKTLSEYRTGAFNFTELKAHVKILNPWDPSVAYENDYTGRSNVGFYYNTQQSESAFYSDGDGYFQQVVEDALENIILNFINDPKIVNYYSNFEKEQKQSSLNWPMLALTAQNKDAISLENSVDAVVTVTQKSSHGSGCIISNDGYIVTNYHVIGPDTSNTYVIFSSGSKKRCKVVRYSTIYDLALLKVDTVVKNILKLKTDKKISVGADVYAIGTPEDINLGQSVTKGIISGKRNIEERTYIQSDVSVNGGNSGGAMTNKEGELIGIIVAKLVGVGIEGVSFAIPAWYVEEVLKVKVTYAEAEEKPIEKKQPEKKQPEKKKK